MREVNFSIPNANKASVGITAALYDRRALDSTSTLPLINSLNHLAYLTTSSARIRDILTVDGGIERLVCILKEGRSKDMMEMWKWNLAFQCVVNIGVRGSEQVRTRVVEANVVPVIATLLDNHARAAERAREENDPDRRRSAHRSVSGPSGTSSSNQHSTPSRHNDPSENRPSRRQIPPSIRIPPYNSLVSPPHTNNNIAAEHTPTLPQLSLTSPQDPSQESREFQAQIGPSRTLHRHNHTRSQDSRPSTSNETRSNGFLSLDAADGFGLRSVRDADRLPSHLPALQNGITSQPESPTTPGVPLLHSLNAALRVQRRPSLSQQNSGSGDSDDGSNDIPARVGGLDGEPMVDIQASGELDGTNGPAAILTAMQAELAAAEGTENDAFNIARRPGSDGSIISTNLTNVGNTGGPQDRLPTVGPTIDQPGVPQAQAQTRFMPDSRMTPPGVAVMNPRDEDVLMSLQLLAYVSKYCNLRSYFQYTHLVPKLRVNIPGTDSDNDMDCDDEEFILPDDYNIFPLVEKFTVRHNSQDMQYWAGVVMRNLCRKDENQGGIRQCAYYNCNKWEEWPRQFAKCRRCRRTKYCSKECQKNAWVFHRHWCQVAAS